MGQQSNKIIKRRRRADYLKRKQDQAKLGGITKKAPAVKKAAVVVKKTAAKKAASAPAKKAAAKKAPAKKAANDAAVAEVADKTVDATEEIEENAPAPADEA